MVRCTAARSCPQAPQSALRSTLRFALVFSMVFKLFPQGPRGAPRAREERAEGPGPRPGARQGALAAAETQGTDKPVYPFPQFSGRQSAILQGRLPPAAAACPPPGSCRFFDFPLVFPYESAMVQGVLRRSPEVLARGPGATGRSRRSIRFLKNSAFWTFSLGVLHISISAYKHIGLLTI